jgi:hypothetical protein
MLQAKRDLQEARDYECHHEHEQRDYEDLNISLQMRGRHVHQRGDVNLRIVPVLDNACHVTETDHTDYDLTAY